MADLRPVSNNISDVLLQVEGKSLKGYEDSILKIMFICILLNLLKEIKLSPNNKKKEL